MSFLWSYCRQRGHHNSNNALKNQAESMNPDTRKSLTERIVQTLDQNAGDEDENVEAMLESVENDLEQANKRLSTLEEKEKFLAIRIKKYQDLLGQQERHLESLRASQQFPVEESAIINEAQQQQLQHYNMQMEKQQNNKEALGKVVDVHLDILKHVKDCKRTIATLEKKKYELSTITKKCREFLVMAEEAEREQQLGVIENDDDLLLEPSDGATSQGEVADLDAMELAPLAAPVGANKETPSKGNEYTEFEEIPPVVEDVEDSQIDQMECVVKGNSNKAEIPVGDLSASKEPHDTGKEVDAI